MKIAVGSSNPAKLKAVRIVVSKFFPKAKIVGVNVDSNVVNQPMSDKESIKGAVNRARNAQIISKADFGLGMEGGMNKIGSKWFECGWAAVIDKNGRIGLGSSGRFEVSQTTIKQINSGKELGEILDEITSKKGLSKKGGMMGVITKGHLSRKLAYSHGVFFAFAPFISDKKFWD